MTEGYTIASVLKKSGYSTGLFGKWGLGFPGSPSEPLKAGFDHFFGYNCQRHAHTYYPDWLHDGETVFGMPENKEGRKTHSAEVIKNRTLKFIEDNQGRPFFCYAAWTMPHGKYTAPDTGRFGKEPWSKDVQNYAAMVELLDAHLGEVRAKLKQLGLEKDTLLIFTSDNGANQEFVKDLASTAGLRGTKRSLHEGGIRSPFLAVWPGRIKAGSRSDLLAGHVDVLATCAEMAGAGAPANDGVSLLPTLTGEGKQQERDFLYWEFYEGRFQQALRAGQWKAYREGALDAPLKLYDLSQDPHEDRDLAASQPELVARFAAILAAQHQPSPIWRAPGEGGKSEQPKTKKNRGS
jgi:arylsulfatase A-like enzyme